MIPFKMINGKKNIYAAKPKIKKKMNPKISFKVLTLNMTPSNPNNVINISNINYLNNNSRVKWKKFIIIVIKKFNKIIILQ